VPEQLRLQHLPAAARMDVPLLAACACAELILLSALMKQPPIQLIHFRRQAYLTPSCVA
jgi:hypothetical protein